MVFLDLLDLYAEEGYTVRTSIGVFLPPTFAGDMMPDGYFTYIYKDGVNWGSGGGGISLSEIYFFETVGAHKPAKRIFGIGCSFGWSTLALALSNPGSKSVAIDIGWGTSTNGLEVTNRIAARAGLNVKAVLGASPEAVPGVMAQEFDGPIDLVFIDGEHNNAAQSRDFDAVLPYLAEDAVILFHDVYMCGMSESLAEIAARMPNHETRILSRTASGIGAMVPKKGHEGLRRAVGAFVDPFAPLPI